MHITPTHKNPRQVIDVTSFDDCSNLTNEEFCDEIEMFVSCKAMQDWWNQGVHEKSLNIYCFLVQDSIPAQQVNIHEMLNSIPTIPGRLWMLTLIP
jgi:hypothetical protein